MTKTLEEMLPILRCPRSGTTLRRRGNDLISEAGDVYPIVDGKPITVMNLASLHVTPPSKGLISKNISEFVVSANLPSDAIIVHLGCGDVPSSDPRVISIDILPTQSADLVAEAEFLPFAECSVDYVVSGAVFEHVYNPLQAAAEVRRILKEGGRFHVDTAFMQGYHGYPSHYFNMTPQAAETHLVDDFILEASVIPESGTPLHALSEIFSRFLKELPKDVVDRLMRSTLADFMAEVTADRSFRNPLLSEWSEYARRSLAASVIVAARKPTGYRPAPSHAARSARRLYYASRATLTVRHHEIHVYRRLASEAGSTVTIALDPPTLTSLLMECQVTDTQKESAFLEATVRLEEKERELREIRDNWIRAYLTARPSSN
jgi:SAM-dependent methyltransferase